MSEILTPNDFDVSILSWVEDGAMRQAGKRHDAALRAENERLTAACRMVLLFHNAGYWTKANADEWANVTGETDATTRVLCDTVRRALDPPALAPADAGKEKGK